MNITTIRILLKPILLNLWFKNIARYQPDNFIIFADFNTWLAENLLSFL